MNAHIGARVAVIATLIAVAVWLVRLATPPPNLIDHCDYERDVVDSAPIVVVGVLMSDVLVSRPIDALSPQGSPYYRPDPQSPVEYALVDLHLTRGEGTVNKIAFATKAFREEPSNISELQEYAVTEQDENQIFCL